MAYPRHEQKRQKLEVCRERLGFYLDRGGLSHKQIENLQRIFDRVLDTFERDQLEVQGAPLAIDDGSPANIVTFSSRRTAQ